MTKDLDSNASQLNPTVRQDERFSAQAEAERVAQEARDAEIAFSEADTVIRKLSPTEIREMMELADAHEGKAS